MILRLALVFAALGAALVPLPSRWVESLYSVRVYPPVQRVLTQVSNGTPFALFDLLLAAAVAWLAFTLVASAKRWRQSGFLRAVGGLLVSLAAFAAGAYLVFLVAWGLNYRRLPMTTRVDYSRERVTPEATAALARRAIGRANELDAEVHRGGWPGWNGVLPLLGPSFARVQRELAPGGAPAVPGLPKRTLLTYYFERSGVDGMTDPFLLETLVNQSVLPFERPSIVAHEWAHLAGYADESEANFVGWLVCLQAAPAAEYSGYLSLLWQLLPALPRGEREAALHDLHAPVRADLRAIAERVARTSPIVRRVSWRVYDRYLKANRVEKGVESYTAAVDLIVGTRFVKGWVPALRGQKTEDRRQNTEGESRKLEQ